MGRSVAANRARSGARLPVRPSPGDHHGVTQKRWWGVFRTILIIVLLALGLSLPARAQSAVDEASASIVRVVVVIQADNATTLLGAGSGFVVANNLIVTNAHVVAQAREVEGASVAVVAPNGDGPVPARIVSYSAMADLALIEVRGANLTPLTISTAEPRPGDSVIALGYPDVDDVRSQPEQMLRPTAPSRTSGAIASLRDRAPTGDPVPIINHEAVISSGSSGGPLIDECGHVLGVNTWHARGRDTSESRSVATRAIQLLDFLDEAGVRARTTSERCPTMAERVEAERASTVDALQAQNRDLAAKLEAADRLTRMALVILIAGTLSLLVAVIVLAAVLFGRGHAPKHAEAEAEPETHHTSLRRGARGVLTVVGGATVAAVLVVAAGVFVWRVQGLGASPPAAEVFAGDQVCTLDRNASKGAAPTDGDAEFSAAGDLCVNGRTLYAPGPDGRSYRRALLNNGGVDILTLDPRGRRFSRDHYDLDDTAYEAALAAIGQATQDGCGDPARAAVRARNDALMRFAEGEPDRRLVWRCTKRP